MGGLSELSGGVGAGDGSSVGNAGPATSGGTGGNVFNLASGGGSGFNPFANQSGLSSPLMLVVAGGVMVIGALLLKRKK